MDRGRQAIDSALRFMASLERVLDARVRGLEVEAIRLPAAARPLVTTPLLHRSACHALEWPPMRVDYQTQLAPLHSQTG